MERHNNSKRKRSESELLLVNNVYWYYLHVEDQPSVSSTPTITYDGDRDRLLLLLRSTKILASLLKSLTLSFWKSEVPTTSTYHVSVDTPMHPSIDDGNHHRQCTVEL